MSLRLQSKLKSPTFLQNFISVFKNVVPVIFILSNNCLFLQKFIIPFSFQNRLLFHWCHITYFLSYIICFFFFKICLVKWFPQTTFIFFDMWHYPNDSLCVEVLCLTKWFCWNCKIRSDKVPSQAIILVIESVCVMCIGRTEWLISQWIIYLINVDSHFTSLHFKNKADILNYSLFRFNEFYN